MSERPGVLVLGAGGNVTQGIQKALAASPRGWRVVAGCVAATSVGLHLADRAYVGPYADDPGFVAWVIEVSKSERVVAILSGVEEVLAALAPHQTTIREASGATVVTSEPQVLAVAADKGRTAQWLTDQGLPAPLTARGDDRAAVAALIERTGWPVIVKPARGKGGQGVQRVSDQRALNGALSDDDVVQQFLGSDDQEYTVGCVCDQDGRLVASMPMRRELAHGTTVRAWAGSFPAVEAAAREIVSQLRPIGPCNVQMRVDAGQPICFEINARFSGTTPARVRMGFDEVDAVLAHLALGERMPELHVPRSGTMLRYWNEVYVPPDDLEALAKGTPAPGHATVEDWGI